MGARLRAWEPRQQLGAVPLCGSRVASLDRLHRCSCCAACCRTTSCPLRLGYARQTAPDRYSIWVPIPQGAPHTVAANSLCDARGEVGRCLGAGFATGARSVMGVWHKVAGKPAAAGRQCRIVVILEGWKRKEGRECWLGGHALECPVKGIEAHAPKG
eukprot:1143563-Pelagomonas_calceolata.AAC.4